MKTSPKKIDIIIPVFNAIDCVVSCINSINKYCLKNINKIIIMDDASSPETKKKLDELEHKNLTIIHNEKNLGFGANVNKGFTLSNSEYVLVLNSDTEAENDFIKPLIDALDNNPSVSAVNPTLPQKSNKNIKYKKQNNVITSYMLSGYAFLVRRSLFLDIGGFNPVFGRGYFEDTALGRELNKNGHYTGLVSNSVLKHEEGQSFSSELRNALEEKNGPIFRKMYPDSLRRIMVITDYEHDALPEKLIHELKEICISGGKTFVFSKKPLKLLPNKSTESKSNSLTNIISFVNRTVIRTNKRKFNKTTEVWIFRKGNKTSLTLYILKAIFRMKSLTIREI